LMGNKVNAIHAVRAHGIPTVPGSADQPDISAEALANVAEKIGYPVLVKAAAGGGGRGMKVAHQASELKKTLTEVQSEAQKLYHNDLVYIEKYLQRPRHVEVQIIADQHGNVVCVGDRDCSLQRRHQKIIEEAPAIDIPEQARNQLFHVCRKAMSKIGYVGLGTLEFLYENGSFYFIEMNTRVQVEHPVTEMITGIDLIQEQLRIHAGHPLRFSQDQVLSRGHAIECRINAENPITMQPSPGLIESAHFPGGNGVRVDTHVYSGFRVSHRYDSMIAKIITHADTRELAINKMQQALRETHISGIHTNIDLHIDILTQTAFQTGDLHIHYLAKT
jgi:acetyl-CoA carboxylase biotin carboxylase subunit